MILPTPWRLYAAAGIALAGAYSGWKVRDWQCDAAVAKALKQAEQDRSEAQGAVDRLALSYEELREKAYANRDAASGTIREIYRDVAVGDNCAAPAAAVGVLNGRVDSANAARTGQSGRPMP